MYTLSSANVDTCLGVSRGVIPPPQAGVAAPGNRPCAPAGGQQARAHSGWSTGLSVASIYCNLIPRY